MHKPITLSISYFHIKQCIIYKAKVKVKRVNLRNIFNYKEQTKRRSYSITCDQEIYRLATLNYNKINIIIIFIETGKYKINWQNYKMQMAWLTGWL